MLNISGLAVCRICHSSEQSGPVSGEPLYSPCQCKGSMGLFHRYCLEKWLVTSRTNYCEICQFKFQIRHQLPTVYDFMKDQTIRKDTVPDLICFLVLTPLSICSIIMCLYGFCNSGDYLEGNMEYSNGYAVTFLFLTIVLTFTYVLWVLATCLHHFTVFKGWRKSNTRLRIRNIEDSKVTDGDSIFSTKIDMMIPMVDTHIQPPGGCEGDASPGIEIPDSFTSRSVSRSFTATSTPRH